MEGRVNKKDGRVEMELSCTHIHTHMHTHTHTHAHVHTHTHTYTHTHTCTHTHTYTHSHAHIHSDKLYLLTPELQEIAVYEWTTDNTHFTACNASDDNPVSTNTYLPYAKYMPRSCGESNEIL